MDIIRHFADTAFIAKLDHVAHVQGHQAIYGGDEGLRHHLCVSHGEHMDEGASREELEERHEDEHPVSAAHRGEYSCPDGEHDDQEPGEFEDLHEGLGEIHRGIGVNLPDELHRFVHDPARPRADRARALLEHVSNHPASPHGGLGTHWTTGNDVAESFAETSGKWSRDEDEKTRPASDHSFGSYAEQNEDDEQPRRYRLPKPGTAVVFHAHEPDRSDIDDDPNGRYGNGDVYGHTEHGEREVPINPGANLRLRGISWAQMHAEEDPDESHWWPEYEHHDFGGHEPREAAVDQPEGHFGAAAAAHFPHDELLHHLLRGHGAGIANVGHLSGEEMIRSHKARHGEFEQPVPAAQPWKRKRGDPWYHVSPDEFAPGQMLTPQGIENTRFPESSGAHVYFTGNPETANYYAEQMEDSLAGAPRVYEVKPTGRHTPDPQDEDSRQTIHPVQVVREVPRGTVTPHGLAPHEAASQHPEGRDWFYGEQPAHTAELPDEMHRGIPVRLPPEIHEAVHDDTRPVGERARMVMDHLDRWGAQHARYGEGGLGTHWSTSERVAHGFGSTYHPDDVQDPKVPWHEKRQDPATTRVVFHAQTAQPGQMIRGERTMREHDIFGVNHGEGEVPLRKRSRVALTGISWSHNETGAPLTRHDFPKPVARNAGTYVAPAPEEAGYYGEHTAAARPGRGEKKCPCCNGGTHSDGTPCKACDGHGSVGRSESPENCPGQPQPKRRHWRQGSTQDGAGAVDSGMSVQAGAVPAAERTESVRHMLDHYQPRDADSWDEVREMRDWDHPSSREFVDDVRRNGVQRPIPVDYEQDPPVVMNGHTRLLAAERGGRETVPTRQHTGFMDPDDPDYLGRGPDDPEHYSNWPHEGALEVSASAGDGPSGDYKDLLGHFQAADYSMQHTAPNPAAGHKPLHHYTEDSPDEHVQIYRSAPPGTESINPGDWISLNADYAHQHGRHATDSSRDWPVYTASVPQRHVHWDENDENEHGYNGPAIRHPDVHDEETGGHHDWDDWHEEHPHGQEAWAGGAVHLPQADHDFVHDEFEWEPDRADTVLNAAREQGALRRAHWHDDLYPARDEAEAHAATLKPPEGHRLTTFTVHRTDNGKVGDVAVHPYRHDDDDLRRYRNMDMEEHYYEHPAVGDVGRGEPHQAAYELPPPPPREYSAGRMRVSDILIPGEGRLSDRPYTQRELADDIRRNGVQQPIAVEHLPAHGGPTSFNGMHRLDAARMAGVPDVPVVVKHLPGQPPPMTEHRPSDEQEFNDAFNLERAGRWAREHEAALAVTADTEDYHMRHRPGAPEDDAGGAMHDVEDMLPGVYDHPERYTYGDPVHRESAKQVRTTKGRPDAPVTIYRALPHPHMTISPGDWVSTSAAYARGHGESNIRNGQWHVIRATVPARHLWSEGNSISEWGYHGPALQAERHEGPHLGWNEMQREATASLALEAAMHEPLENPHTGGHEWYHGSPYRFSSFHGDQPDSPLHYQADEEDGSHWNTLLGHHFAASHQIAEEFSRGEHSATPEGSYDDATPQENVVHARLGIRNPKVYGSEHDMDQEAYEHEWKAGNHHDQYHDPDLTEDDDWEVDDRPATYQYAGHGDRMRGRDEADPVYWHVHRSFHPYATGWLNSHPDKAGIADRFRRRLAEQGHDGMVYGNEFEGERIGKGDNHHIAAVPFSERQIDVTQRHTGHECVPAEAAARQWPGRNQPALFDEEGHLHEGSLAVVAHFGDDEDEHDYDPADFDHPEHGYFDEEHGVYHHPVHGYWCHACGDYHDDAETAEAHGNSYTDWDRHYPGLPAEMHRGLRIDGGAYGPTHLGREGQHPHEAAQEILHHVGGEFGTHWTPDLDQARHYAAVGNGSLGDKTDWNVVIHARKPERQHIETDPDTLSEQNVISYGDHDDAEIPLREGAPVHLTGVSWKRDHEPDSAWQRHTFEAAHERTAALDVVAHFEAEAAEEAPPEETERERIERIRQERRSRPGRRAGEPRPDPLAGLWTPIPPEELEAQRKEREPKPERVDDRDYSIGQVSRHYDWEGFDPHEISHLVSSPEHATFTREDVPVHSLRHVNEHGALVAAPSYHDIASQGEEEQGRLEELERGYDNGDPIPPIVAVRDGEHHIIADGSHRAAVHAQRGQTHIPAFVTQRTIYPEQHTAALEEPPDGTVITVTAAWDASGSDSTGIYLRFGHWPKNERSFSPAGGYHEEGVSTYDLDRHGNPAIDHGLDRGHVHDDDCDVDELGTCEYSSDPWHNPDNDPREEMQGRVHRAERNRYNGADKPSETGHLVRGEMTGVGYDGEPLLKNVRRVGDWIDHRHLLIPGAQPHRLARDPSDEDYEPPEEAPAGRTAALEPVVSHFTVEGGYMDEHGFHYDAEHDDGETHLAAPYAGQQLYHGTRSELEPGEMLTPGDAARHPAHHMPDDGSDYVHATPHYSEARYWGQHADPGQTHRRAVEMGRGRQRSYQNQPDHELYHPRVYEVHPTGDVEPDPNGEGQAYRSASPMRVGREVWPIQCPDCEEEHQPGHPHWNYLREQQEEDEPEHEEAADEHHEEPEALPVASAPAGPPEPHPGDEAAAAEANELEHHLRTAHGYTSDDISAAVLRAGNPRGRRNTLVASHKGDHASEGFEHWEQHPHPPLTTNRRPDGGPTRVVPDVIQTSMAEHRWRQSRQAAIDAAVAEHEAAFHEDPDEDEGYDDDSGDDYTTCDQGHTHWGTNGAAGLLVRHRGDDGQTRFLLQHRSPYVQHGSTWSTPGGAMHAGEAPEHAALREATEELGDLPGDLTHHRTHTDDHGGWAYHTVVMDAPRQFHPGGGDEDWEHGGHGWFTRPEIDDLDLHPGFRSSWRQVTAAAAPSFTWNYTTYGPTGYVDKSEEVEGPFYHGSRSRALGEGDQLTRGRKLNPWGDEGSRSQYNHFTTDLAVAREYADRAGGHVYEVEPTGEVQGGYQGGEWKSKHPLKVRRVVPPGEAAPPVRKGGSAAPGKMLIASGVSDTVTRSTPLPGIAAAIAAVASWTPASGTEVREALGDFPGLFEALQHGLDALAGHLDEAPLSEALPGIVRRMAASCLSAAQDAREIAGMSIGDPTEGTWTGPHAGKA